MMPISSHIRRALGPVAITFLLLGSILAGVVVVSAPAVEDGHGAVASSLRASSDSVLTPTGSASSQNRGTSMSGSNASLANCSLVRPSELLPNRLSDRIAVQQCAAREAAAHAPAVVGASGWEPTPNLPPGFETYNMALTYDSADGYLLLYGSVGGSGPLNGTETWTYEGGVWSQLHPANSPESCPSSSLAYDSVDGYVVYFGGGGWGGGNCSSTGQTWTFTGGVWTQLHPTTSPSARDAASFTNDSLDGYLLLFGGILDTASTPEPTNQTWTFVGGTWTELHPSSAPSPRSSAGLAYDAADQYVLLFGGSGNGYGDTYDDTWTYHAGDWTQLSPTSHPIAPWPDGLAYDGFDHVVVYTSAENLSYIGPEQVWTFAAGNWTEWLAGHGNNGVYPPERLAEVTGYDWHDGYFVLFGGTRPGWQPLNDLWSFHGSNWTNLSPIAPSPRTGAAGVYDAADGYYLLFGGSGNRSALSDTWTWVNGTWTHLSTNQSPPAMSGASLTYDASDGYVLLVGDTGGSTVVTWEFTDGGWTQITPAQSPPAGPTGQNLVYDAADGYVVFLDAAATISTWSYHGGVWTNLTSDSTTVPTYPTNGLTYDAADGRVVLFGTQYTIGNGAYATADTWTFLNGVWTNVTASVGPAPPARWYGGLTYDATQGYVLLFGGWGESSGALLNDTWSYVGGNWTQLVSAVAPPAREYATLGYDPNPGVALLFGGGIDSSLSSSDCLASVCGDTWEWTGAGASSPVVAQFNANSNPVDINAETNFSVDVYGGAPPYTYSYSGLPAGCTSTNTSLLGCTPTQLGNFSVSVYVVDTAGNGTSATTTLSVVPGLVVTSFNATPARVEVGERTLLSVTTSGGVSPVGYVYAGLPPGCTSQTVPTLPCSPEETGTFSVNVTATDAAHRTSSASLTLIVTSAGPATGPQILSFGISPDAILLGNVTALFLNASGGTGPLSLAYSGLPAGCASANLTPLTCAPTTSGVFTVTFSAVDPAGASVSVEANLTVYPVGGGGAALITAFGASPGTVTVGNAAVLTVDASGGTAPLSYSYPSLPPGCYSADTPNLPCKPTSAGTFAIRVVVTDARGNTSGARATLTVVQSTVNVPPSGGSVGPTSAYLGWVLAAVLGLIAAAGVTARVLARRRLRGEGNALVAALNEEAAAADSPPTEHR
jgi:hypothetical protein